jgi:hypothetical protein
MKTVIALFFCVVGGFASGADKLALEIYRLVPAIDGRPSAESARPARLVLKLVNNTDKPFYFMGWSQTDFQVTIERKTDGWVVDKVPAGCGNGIDEQVIMPHSYVVFDSNEVFYPWNSDGTASTNQLLPTAPVRFRFMCYEDGDAKKPVEAVSREILPKEFRTK